MYIYIRLFEINIAHLVPSEKPLQAKYILK